ncbi:MAG: hypothetical protein COB07_12675 [Sulfurovum sp.]|nr:MAG: hypothetical protein COB07_12675 [Sulfurovum sp.]
MPIKHIILPDFIIIGANKAGTTSVANYLNSNISINISTVKEPMFFNSLPSTISETKENANLAKPYFALDIYEYSSLFESKNENIKIYGEASTAYLANPKRSALLMRKIVPNVKIIAILREPTERAVSAYKMCYGNSIENRTFKDIVANAQNELKIIDNHGVKEYIRNGLYSQLLEPYFSYFNSENILLLNYDELKYSPKIFMERISKFLNIELNHVNYTKKYNEASEHTSKREYPIDSEDIQRLNSIYEEEKCILKEKYGFSF